MTNIVLNEKACAEYALENLILGSKPTETLGRVARYYYSIGYKKKEIEFKEFEEGEDDAE